jgi:hypothetical protein
MKYCICAFSFEISANIDSSAACLPSPDITRPARTTFVSGDGLFLQNFAEPT